MDLSKASLNEYRLHAVTILTAASAAMSQIDNIAIYAPIATSLAFLAAATSYKDALIKVQGVVDSLEDAEVIDEDVANAVEDTLETVESVAENLDNS